ncbi:hypothetical protein Tco_0441092 [Tanacetum coccineum]
MQSFMRIRFSQAKFYSSCSHCLFVAIQLMAVPMPPAWDQIPTNIATACHFVSTSNQNHFPVNTLTSKVFSFMVKKGKHFSGKVTPLFATMLTDSSPAQTSEVPLEHQPNQSPRPSPTTTIPDSIPDTSGENLGGHSSSDKSLSGNEGDMTLQSVYDLCLSLCCTEIYAQSEGRTKEMVDEDKEINERILSTKDCTWQIEGTDEQVEGTEEHNEGTEENIESTEEHIEGTEEQVESTDGHKKGTEEEIAAQATQTSTQTPISKIFRDNETIAKVLLNMSQAKAIHKEKRKVVLELKDSEKKFKQLESDEELARKMQEEWEAEEERNRIAEEDAANEAL